MAGKTTKVKTLIEQARGCIAHAQFSNSDAYTYPDRQQQIQRQHEHLGNILTQIENEAEAMEQVADAYSGKGPDSSRILGMQPAVVRSPSAQREHEREHRREAMGLNETEAVQQ